MKINSNSGMLDVKTGRACLKRLVKRGEKPKLLIEAEITDVGNDDGISCEFELHVLFTHLMEK